METSSSTTRIFLVTSLPHSFNGSVATCRESYEMPLDAGQQDLRCGLPVRYRGRIVHCVTSGTPFIARRPGLVWTNGLYPRIHGKCNSKCTYRLPIHSGLVSFAVAPPRRQRTHRRERAMLKSLVCRPTSAIRYRTSAVNAHEGATKGRYNGDGYAEYRGYAPYLARAEGAVP